MTSKGGGVDNIEKFGLLHFLNKFATSINLGLNSNMAKQNSFDIKYENSVIIHHDKGRFMEIFSKNDSCIWYKT